MQSMVRFLLYANEFDIEGLIASAGTFAMEAHKENILGVLDRYEMVYENLKTHDPVSDLAWVNENIRFNHGPLCEVYPHEGMGNTGVCEGDTPSFLWLISANRGINDPEDPTQPSWGGQYVRKPGTNHYVDGPGGSSISRWQEDYQKEFKERADWCIKPKSK